MKTVKHYPKAPNTLKWGKRIVDIAKDEGVSRSRIYQRIERHGTPFAKDIVSIHNIKKTVMSKNIIKWGKSIADIAKDEGVAPVSIYQRIQKHGTPFKL